MAPQVPALIQNLLNDFQAIEADVFSSGILLPGPGAKVRVPPPTGKGRAPLGATAEKLRLRLVDGALACARLIEAGELAEWLQGRHLYLIKQGNLWRLDPRAQGLKHFYDYGMLVLGCDSASTVRKRLALGEHFTLDEYLNFRERGVGHWVLSEIYACRKDQPIWAWLRELAWEHIFSPADFKLARVEARSLYKKKELLRQMGSSRTMKDAIWAQVLRARAARAATRQQPPKPPAGDGAEEKELRAQVKTLQEQVARLEQEQVTARARYEAAEAEVQRQREEVARLSTQQGHSRQALEQAYLAQREAQVDRDRLAEELRGASSDREEVEARLAAATAQMEVERAQVAARLEATEQQLHQATVGQQRLEGELGQVAAAQQQAEQSLVEAQTRLALQRQEMERLSAELSLRQQAGTGGGGAPLDQMVLERYQQACHKEEAAESALRRAQVEHAAVETRREEALGRLAEAQREQAQAAAERLSGVQLREKAEADAQAAEQLLAEAQQQAQGLLSSAQAAVERQHQQAQAEIDQARQQAQTEIDQLRQQAQIDADHLRQQAQTEADDLRQQAQTAHQQAQIDADDLRQQAQTEADHLRQQVQAELEQAQAQRQQLQAQSADLDKLRHDFDLKQAAVDEEASALSAQHDALLRRHKDLDSRQASLDTASARLQEDFQRLTKVYYDMGLALEKTCLVTWRDSAFGLDAILLSISDHLLRLAQLMVAATEWLDRGSLPIHGGMPQIMEVHQSLAAISRNLPNVIDEITGAYHAKFPDKAQAWLEDYKAGIKPAIGEGQLPQIKRPVQKFALPTRVLIGTPAQDTAQQMVLGTTRDGKELITLDLNEIQSVLLVGEPNYGKTNSLGVLMESMLGPLKNLSDTQVPFGVVLFHWAPDANGRAPKWRNYLMPNDEPKGLANLKKLGAGPAGWPPGARRVVFVAPDQVERRRAEYPGWEVLPFLAAPEDLTLDLMLAIMGTGKDMPLYMRKISRAVEGLVNPSGEEFIARVEALDFPEHIAEIVAERLAVLRKFLGGSGLRYVLLPGTVVAFDLRAPYINQKLAMVLMTVAVNALSQATIKGVDEKGEEAWVPFMKALVFDEAHLYMTGGILVETLERVMRMMRHYMCWVLAGTQEPENLDGTFLGLPQIKMLHRTKSKKSLKALADRDGRLTAEVQEKVANQQQGEVTILVNEASDEQYRLLPIEGTVRAMCAKPTGTTQTAVPAPPTPGSNDKK